jgi:AsmA protein
MIQLNAHFHLIRRLAIACGGLLVLSFAGLISLPISSAAILSELKASISRDVAPVTRIEGSASLHLLPQPTVDLSSVTLSFENNIELKAPRISFGLRVFSLLGGRYEPVSMHLESPAVTIPDALVPKSANDLSPVLAASIAGPAIQQRQIETITLNGGSIGSLTGQSAASNATKLKAAVYLSADGTKSLSASGLWRQQEVSLKIDFGAADPKQAQARTLSLDLTTPTGTLWLKGEAFRDGKAQFDGRIVSTITRLDQLSEWLALAPPINIATSLVMDGKARLTPLMLAISDAQVKLGAVQMTGGISFDVSGPRPLVTGTLSAGDMDVTTFLTPIWPKQASAAGWKLDPVDPELTPRQDLDIRLSADRVNLGIVRISNVALAIMAKDRALDITLASAKLFQGSAKGKLTIQPAERGFTVSTHGSFDTIDLGQSTLALMDMKKIDGSASGKFTFDASGPSLDQWMKTLSGSTELLVTNGSMTGINISSVLKRIETRPLSVIRDMRGGTTDFESMRLAAQLNNGIARLGDADMKFLPNHMALTGSIDIGKRNLNLAGEASAPAPANGAEPAVLAYTITGSFDDPVLTPDINRILKRSGGSPATAD